MDNEHSGEPHLRRRRRILLWIVVILGVLIAAFIFIYNQDTEDSKDRAQREQSEPDTASEPLPGMVPEDENEGEGEGAVINANVSNMSFVVSDGQTLFYTDISGDGICARDAGGGAGRVLDDRPSYYAGLAGDYVCYYAPPAEGDESYGAVTRIRKDGTARSDIVSAPGVVTSMCTTTPGGIYFTVSEPSGSAGVYSVPVSGGAMKKLTDGACDMINMEDGDIYFRRVDAEPPGTHLMIIGTDGSSLRSAFGGTDDLQVGFYAVSGDNIYFTDGDRHLYLAGASGDAGRRAIESSADISAFNMADGHLYCVTIERDEDAPGALSESIWRYGADGVKDEAPLASGLIPGSPINIVEGKIYFFEPGGQDGAPVMYRMSTDGTVKEAF
jgi:hypothetical protein